MIDGHKLSAVEAMIYYYLKKELQIVRLYQKIGEVKNIGTFLEKLKLINAQDVHTNHTIKYMNMLYKKIV